MLDTMPASERDTWRSRLWRPLTARPRMEMTEAANTHRTDHGPLIVIECSPEPHTLLRMSQNVGADELTHSQRKDEQQRPPIGEQNEPSS